jgi:hypothetical protein
VTHCRRRAVTLGIRPHPRASGVPDPQIAHHLVIPSGKNKGEHPSVATVYRVLSETDATDTTTCASRRQPW